MRHAKLQGKNTSQFYSSELNARALQRLNLAGFQRTRHRLGGGGAFGSGNRFGLMRFARR